jgi:hypothetical protein
MKAPPLIGNMLKAHVKKNRLFQSGWARQQGVHPKTIATYLKNPTMRIDTLFTICQVLEYNFFREIADALPEQLPPHPVSKNETRIIEMEQRVKDLELQNATLEKALKLVGGG